MTIYLDSWWEPADNAIAWAKQQGFAGWLGYFSNGSDGIYHGWSDSTFARIKAAGLHTAAYCSSRANAGALRARGAAVGVPLILDCEASVDGGDGAQVDPWLVASGASLYGDGATILRHRMHGHAGYVMAGYVSNSGTPNPIDPGLTWGTVPLPSPSRPIGRQYAGGVPTPFGPVDYSHFDPAFFGAATTGGFLMALTDEQQATLFANVQEIHNTLFAGEEASLIARIDGNATGLVATVAELKAAIAALPASGTSGPLKVTLTGTAQP